jgi:hypothetical protein
MILIVKLSVGKAFGQEIVRRNEPGDGNYRGLATEKSSLTPLWTPFEWRRRVAPLKYHR